jgi:CheY-like chemotaxis protein
MFDTGIWLCYSHIRFHMSTSPHSTPNILLVDDSRDGLLVRRSLLEELGYRVEIAISGEEGLKLFELSNFDVVVTDFRMPGMDGRQFIERLRQLDPKARVIMLSGFVDPLGLTEQNTGADAVIAKTCSEWGHLVRSLKRLMNRGARKPPASQKDPSTRARAANG